MVDGSFGRTVAILERALDLRSMRHELLVTNVANLDTPGYRAVDLDFSRELDRAQGRLGDVTLAVAHPRHFPYGPDEAGGVSFGHDETWPSLQSVANDGNSVDLEREMAKLAENHLMHNAVAQILSRSFAKLRYSIDEGGK